MIGYYTDEVNEEVGPSLAVPYVFSIFERKKEGLEIKFDPNYLEETVLSMRSYSRGIIENIYDEEIELINIDDDFLKDLNNLIWNKEHGKASRSIISLFETIKIIKSNYKDFDRKDLEDN